jgi:error-prone DNA polymerase
MLAINDTLYHAPDRRPLQDVLTCIRLHERLESAGRQLQQNAERHLKPAEDILRLFENDPAPLHESLKILQEVQFSLDDLRYEYPEEPAGECQPAGRTGAVDLGRCQTALPGRSSKQDPVDHRS